MATKKEIAKEKAIKGGMPSDVADNIFRMQMGAHGSQNSPGAFRIKDQKTMAMSTMFQTPDPDGELGTLELSTPDQTVTSIRQTEVDIPASRKVEQFAADPQAFFNTMSKEAAAKGWKGSVSDYIKNKEQQLGYRGRTDIIEDVDTTVIPGEKRTLNAFDQISQGFDSVVSGDKGAGGGPKQDTRKTGTGGMADTFSAFDTRQAARKAIIEGRREKQAAKREARAKMKKGDITRKQFREKKKQAKLDQATARREAMEKIAAQGKAQRSAGKNPATTKEFDPSSVLFMTNKSMSFRNKKK
jgi:hypothetical protein